MFYLSEIHQTLINPTKQLINPIGVQSDTDNNLYENNLQLSSRDVPVIEKPIFTALRYFYDKDIKRTILQIIDEHNEPIKQIPSKEAIKQYKAITEMLSLYLDFEI